MPPNQPSNAKIMKRIGNMERTLETMMVDDEKKTQYRKKLAAEKSKKAFKNTAIEEWRAYRETLSAGPLENLPTLDVFMEEHYKIFEEFYETYHKDKTITEKQKKKQREIMEGILDKIKHNKAPPLEVTKEEKKSGASGEAQSALKQVVGPDGEMSRMTADINLMSKMPSYLRPFSN